MMRTTNSYKRRWAPVVIAAMLAGPLAVPSTATTAIEPAHLALGGEAFQGPFPFDGGSVGNAALCGIVGECPEWQLTVDDGGSQLRVAVGTVFQDPTAVRAWADFAGSAPENIVGLQIIDEAGTVLTETSTGEFGTAYAAEAFLSAPAAGTYTVRVVPVSVIDMAFRLRAKLEVPVEAGPGKPEPTVLSPNLRAIPPFEFSFYSPTASYGPGVPVGNPQASCMAEEIEEAAEFGRAIPRLCLRYSMGFENSGDGMFWLSVHCPACEYYYPHTKPAGQAVCDLLFGCVMGDVEGEPGTSRDWPLTQVRFYSDGTCCEVESFGSAGVGRLHPTHGHLHYQNAYFFELFRVNDEGWVPGGKKPKHLDLVGPGGKLGVFPGDEMMSDWDRFYQSPFRNGCPPHTPDHCGPGMGNGPLIGLGEPTVNAGWGDVYEWNRGGNYVDFPVGDGGKPLEGYYVLRGTSDPDRLIIETNEKDNSSYGFIHVSSDGTVQLLERGYGTDPWDHKREVAEVVPG